MDKLDIAVVPVYGVEGLLEGGHWDAVLAVMAPDECHGTDWHTRWPEIGAVPRVVVPMSDLGRDGELDDITRAMRTKWGPAAPGPEHAAAILAFGVRARTEGWRRIAVHCYQAVSRSPAAALLLMAVDDGPGAEAASVERLARKPGMWGAMPNLSLLAAGDSLLGRDGALVAACKARFWPGLVETPGPRM